MKYNDMEQLSSKEITNIFLRGIISIILIVILYALFYCFVPIGWYSTDLDSDFNINYETIRNENVNYVFSLSGLKVEIEDKIIVPRLTYSGNTNFVRVIKSEQKYYVVYPVSWKDFSLKKVENTIVNTGSNREVKSSKSISIAEIRSSYQNIPIKNVIFYKTNGGINRLIYNNVDTFKIVTYSYRSEVETEELYWNKEDGYYYLICPGNAERLFVYSEEFSYIDIV